MKHAFVAVLIIALGSLSAAQDIRFSSPGSVTILDSDGRLLFPEGAQTQLLITVSTAQIETLRERWPEPQQIGLPEGTPATDQQLVQAFIDFGLAADVERTKEARRQRRLKALTAAECQKVAETLRLAVTDLPCGGGQ